MPSPCPPPADPSSARGRRFARILAGLFCACLLLLVLDDPESNAILDEEQFVQDGLAAAYHRLTRAGLTSGPFYGLALGATNGLLYVAGRAIGAFGGIPDFLVWFFSHQGLFFVFARLLTAGLVFAGILLLARALSRDVGPAWGSALAFGFAFTAPSMVRVAIGTPHGALLGFSAALLWALDGAARSDHPRRWFVAGAIVAWAFSTMSIGLGLALAAAWASWFHPGEGRLRRVAAVCAGGAAGLVVFGYPIVLHPAEFWEANIRYQAHRQVTTGDALDADLLRLWAVQGAPLWLAGVAGALWGSFPGRRSVATGAMLTALGYLLTLAFLTGSRQAAYSLAALPCLAYASAGLLRARPERTWAVNAGLACVLFAVPAGFALREMVPRLARADLKLEAGRRFDEFVPPGSTVLVDSWYGPRLAVPELLVERYGPRGREWLADPGFRARLIAALPPADQRWRVLAYPEDMPLPDRAALARAGVGFVAVSRRMMLRAAEREAWQLLLDSGALVPLGVLGEDKIRFYRVDAGD